MNEEIKFQSLEELYKRVLPAIRSKVRELHKKGYKYVDVNDVWNYLKDYKWSHSSDLDLGRIVNDILLVNIDEIDDFIKAEKLRMNQEIKKWN